jgi:hypothetical protein
MLRVVQPREYGLTCVAVEPRYQNWTVGVPTHGEHLTSSSGRSFLESIALVDAALFEKFLKPHLFCVIFEGLGTRPFFFDLKQGFWLARDIGVFPGGNFDCWLAFDRLAPTLFDGLLFGCGFDRGFRFGLFAI